MSEENWKAMQWITGPNTGLSSKTIWAHFVADSKPDRPATPADPADFLRCYWLLKIAPEWKPRLSELADRYPHSHWASLVAHWDELTKMLEDVWPESCARGTYANGEPRAVKMYERMEEIERSTDTSAAPHAQGRDTEARRA